MRRDLDEVLVSQKKMIDRLASEDAAADAEAMKEAFRNDIARVRVHCRTRANFELCEVHYRVAIADPPDACRLVNAFLGGHLDEAAMRDAIDASLYRNRG
jgi:hypothetical protein